MSARLETLIALPLGSLRVRFLERGRAVPEGLLEALELDAIDLQILETLQDQGRIPLVKLGEQVGLSSPSVIDRVKKLEDSGIITGYQATVDARKLGKDVTAFIGVSIAHPKATAAFEHTIALVDDVLECHQIGRAHV